jgi:hypothetical protein
MVDGTQWCAAEVAVSLALTSMPIERAFGSEVDYGQIVKVYAGELGPDTARRVVWAKPLLLFADE